MHSTLLYTNYLSWWRQNQFILSSQGAEILQHPAKASFWLHQAPWPRKSCICICAIFGAWISIWPCGWCLCFVNSGVFLCAFRWWSLWRILGMFTHVSQQTKAQAVLIAFHCYKLCSTRCPLFCREKSLFWEASPPCVASIRLELWSHDQIGPACLVYISFWIMLMHFVSFCKCW